MFKVSNTNIYIYKRLIRLEQRLVRLLKIVNAALGSLLMILFTLLAFLLFFVFLNPEKTLNMAIQTVENLDKKTFNFFELSHDQFVIDLNKFQDGVFLELKTKFIKFRYGNNLFVLKNPAIRSRFNVSGFLHLQSQLDIDKLDILVSPQEVAEKTVSADYIRSINKYLAVISDLFITNNYVKSLRVDIKEIKINKNPFHSFTFNLNRMKGGTIKMLAQNSDTKQHKVNLSCDLDLAKFKSINCVSDFQHFNLSSLKSLISLPLKEISLNDLPDIVNGNMYFNFSSRYDSIFLDKFAVNLFFKNGQFFNAKYTPNPIFYKDLNITASLYPDNNLFEMKVDTILQGNQRGDLELFYNMKSLESLVKIKATGFNIKDADFYWHKDYLPDVRKWIIDSLSSGELSKVNLVLKVKQNSAVHEYFLDINFKNLFLKFLPQYEPLLLSSGNVRIDNKGLSVSASEGLFGKASVKNISAKMPFSNLHLLINMQINSLVGDLLRVFDVNDGDINVQKFATANLQTNLALTIPLEKNVSFENIGLTLKGSLTNLSSKIGDGSVGFVSRKAESTNLINIDADLSDLQIMPLNKPKNTGLLNLALYVNSHGTIHKGNVKTSWDNFNFEFIFERFEDSGMVLKGRVDSLLNNFKFEWNRSVLNLQGKLLNYKTLVNLHYALDLADYFKKSSGKSENLNLLIDVKTIDFLNDIKADNVLIQANKSRGIFNYFYVNSNLMNASYQSYKFNYDNKKPLKLEIPNLTDLALAIGSKAIQGGRAEVRGKYNKYLLLDGDFNIKKLKIIKNKNDIYEFKKTRGKIKYIPSENLVSIENATISNNIHSFLINAMLKLQTYEIEGNVYYNFSTVRSLNDTVVIGHMLDLMSLYKKGGVLSVNYKLSGTLFAPKASFQSTNILLFKFPFV